MLFNLLTGRELALEVISGSFENLTYPQALSIPLTVEPLVAAFKTSVGSTAELALYYRTKPEDDFTLRQSAAGLVTCRIFAEYPSELLVRVANASAANSAGVEYYIMGVKK